MTWRGSIAESCMDMEKVIARFEAERQALAMMDHPNIAKVLDAGATETGPATCSAVIRDLLVRRSYRRRPGGVERR